MGFYAHQPFSRGFLVQIHGQIPSGSCGFVGRISLQCELVTVELKDRELPCGNIRADY